MVKLSYLYNMIASNNIHPPKNWQDFEMLCLKLWGEIWNIPDEIDFNSDNAQGQHGVDIYGPIEGGLKYNGIQCKNKKLNLIDGSPNRITTADIQAEVDKAKLFKPALHKLIIATSLPKDQKVEEYIRIQSIEYLNAGLFSIQICFWDFFERKLLECQRIYDWYLKNENFHRVSSAEVVFSDGFTEKIYRPKFQKIVDRYMIKPEEEKTNTSTSFQGNLGFATAIEIVNRENRILFANQLAKEKFDWHQRLWFKLRIKNSGQTVIENFKIELRFEGDFIEVGPESVSGIYAQNFRTDVHGYSDTKRSVYIKPIENVLVQGNSYTSDSIYFKPLIAVQTDVTIYWKILARDFKDNGKLSLKVEPLYNRIFNVHYVEVPEEERKETSFGLIKRPGQRNILTGNISFSDKESDYVFI